MNIATFIEALKLIWIRRLLQSDSKWQDVIKKFVEPDKLAGYNTAYIKKDLINIIYPFWIYVIQK